MQIAARTLRDRIMCGIRTAGTNHFLMTEEPGEKIHPEYLTTAAICFAFAEHIRDNHLIGQLVVRAEELTRILWRKAHLRKRIIASHRRSLIALARYRSGQLGKYKRMATHTTKRQLRLDSSRPGNVDISIFEKSGFEHLFAVIENKGFLSFTQHGDLYTNSRKELIKDLTRNIEFLTSAGPKGGVEYSAFTFYLLDDQSVLSGSAETFCRRKEAYFRKLAQTITNSSTPLLIDVKVETVDAQLFDSHDEADMPDGSGAPAYITEGHWHIACGVISVYNPVRVVTSEGMDTFDDASIILPELRPQIA